MKTTLEGYYTVLVPWSDRPTPWHPPPAWGPSQCIPRGAFPYPQAAHAWAHARLEGQPYTLRYTPALDGDY